MADAVRMTLLALTTGRVASPAARVVLAVLVIVLAGCGGSSDVAAPPPVAQPQTQTITLKGQSFELELALDEDAREQGLSDREAIADDGGMLFVFAYPRATQFVMRRCHVPIDLIFVDEKGYIDSLHAMQVIEPVGSRAWLHPTAGYASAGHILLAIELKGGTIARLGLQRGEKLDLPIEALQSRAE